MELFNNREIATAIWLAIFAAWILTKSEVRKSIGDLFSALLNWKLLVSIAAMVLYTAAVVAALRAVGFWRFPMVKDTVLWFCFTAFVMVMRFTTSKDDESIFRTVLQDSIKLAIFIEFLVGTYVMSLPAELLFVPIITFVIMIDAVAKLDEKNAIVVKLTTFLLSTIGIAVFGYALWRAIGDFRNLGTLDTLRTIALPPVLSIAFIPFIYTLVLFITYEYLFVRLRIGREKTADVIQYAKRRILFHCGFSLRRLRALSQRPPFELMQIETSADVDRLIAFAQSGGIEKP